MKKKVKVDFQTRGPQLPLQETLQLWMFPTCGRASVMLGRSVAYTPTTLQSARVCLSHQQSK